MPPGTEEVLARLDPLLLAAQIVALLILAGVFVKALSWLVPVVRGVRSAVGKAHNVLDAFLGTPEERDEGGFITRPAQPGVMSRLEKIEYHIKSNGGHSAYDQHTKKLDANTQLLQELREIVYQVAMRQSTQSNDLQDLREDYRRALEHNHPDYIPPEEP